MNRFLLLMSSYMCASLPKILQDLINCIFVYDVVVKGQATVLNGIINRILLHRKSCQQKIRFEGIVLASKTITN